MKTAKDTVMNDEQIFRLIASPEELKLLKRFKKASVSGEYHRLALTQAKITWDIAIKEVVEFLKLDKVKPLADNRDPSEVVIKITIGWEEWQAQLKSWGYDRAK